MKIRTSLVLAGVVLAGVPEEGRTQVAGGSNAQVGGGRTLNLGALQQAAIDSDRS